MAALAVALALGGARAADAADRTLWATGTALEKALSQHIDVWWSEDPLRQALGNLSRAQRVAILIDRRVDPGQKLELKLTDVPVESALRKVADSCGLRTARLGAVVYLGPPAAAERLRPLAAAAENAVRRLPSASQRRFLQLKSLTWDDCATPKGLLAELGRENGVTITGLEQVPHDLWAAADLPPLSLVDRLVLITMQFDLGLKIAADGTQVELASLPENLQVPAESREHQVAPQITAREPAAGPSPKVESTRISALTVRRETSRPRSPGVGQATRSQDHDGSAGNPGGRHFLGSTGLRARRERNR